MMKKSILQITLAFMLLTGGFSVAVMAQAPKPGKKSPEAQEKVSQLSQKEKDFQDELSGTVLVGFFTVAGEEKKEGLKEERYTIHKATKLKDSIWVLQARVEYGGKDVTVPIPIKVEWAGDTPMLQLTDLSIPGLGTYTARVLIYRGQYAGTWSGADHGGQLFGRLEKISEKETSEQKKDPSKKPE